MYFSGKDVSKNLDSALYYHFRGLRLNRDPKTSAFNRIKLRDQYSLLYFKSKAPFFTDGFPFNTNNNQSIYPVNPIYLFKSFASTLDGDNFREEIKLLNKDTTLNCLIQFNYSEILGKSMITAIGMNRFGSEVKKFMDKQVIKPERISIRDEYDGKTNAYKSWTLPSLQIMISNKSFN